MSDCKMLNSKRLDVVQAAFDTELTPPYYFQLYNPPSNLREIKQFSSVIIVKHQVLRVFFLFFVTSKNLLVEEEEEKKSKWRTKKMLENCE